jgi:hypothetical protein
MEGGSRPSTGGSTLSRSLQSNNSHFNGPGALFLSKKIGRRPNYYVDSKEDALVMMKDLRKNLPLRHEGTNIKLVI